MRTLRCLIVFLCLGTAAIGQELLNEADIRYFRKYEDSLKVLQKKMFGSKKDNERFEANKQFLAIFDDVMANQKSIYYPFDSLKEISRLTAPDLKFRIITWNVFKNDGTHAYFGFIQVNSLITKKTGLFKKTTKQQYEYFTLVDKSGVIKNPETHSGDPSKWFGMLYYDVVACDDYYTLLGWDGNDKLTQRKFIDILYFKSDGTPIFGKDVFKMDKKYPKRVMFEYSSEISMSLRYNREQKKLIFSHLAPKDPDPTLEGQYQYYGPDGSFDAFTMKKNKWVYEADVDVRKEKSKNDNVRKPSPRKEKTYLYS